MSKTPAFEFAIHYGTNNKGVKLAADPGDPGIGRRLNRRHQTAGDSAHGPSSTVDEQLKQERSELSRAHKDISATSKQLARIFGNRAKEPGHIVARTTLPHAPPSIKVMEREATRAPVSNVQN